MSAINSLTGLDISNFIVVDFKGLADMDGHGLHVQVVERHVAQAHRQAHKRRGVGHTLTAGPSQEGTDSPAATPAPTVDPQTGLIKQPDGTLIDPETGGVVDPETGAIKDPDTNQYVGIAYQYLNNTPRCRPYPH